MMKKRVILGKREWQESSNFGLKNWEMCGISFFGSQFSQLLNILSERQKSSGTKTWVTTVNPEFIMASRSDKKFADIIERSDIKVVDGIGLIWAKEVLKSPRGILRWYRGLVVGLEILSGKRREEVISGSDLIVDISRVARDKGQKIFLLGGWKNRAEESGKFLEKKFPGLKYDFCQGDPEVKNEEVIKRINKFKADYLFVAYGMRHQEEWIAANLAKLEVGVVIGVGRSFDYYSGALKRAPMWVRKMGLEWLFSLIKEPKRWKRQLALPKFVWMVLFEIA